MRTRRWILVIALFIAFTTLVVYHSWNILNVNERIKKYVLNKIDPKLGADFKINKLEMSLGAVHLKNVEVNDNNFLLKIEDIRIGFNFASLIKNSFRPQKIPHDILVIRPYLTINQGFLNTLQNASHDSTNLDSVSYQQYWDKLRKFDFIKRITISKGRMSYKNFTNQQDILFAHDINGWLNTREARESGTRLVGKLFQSEKYNLYVNGSANIDQGHFEALDIQIKNFEWKKNVSLFIPDYFNIKKGMINGEIKITKRGTNQKGFDILGEIAISDGTMQISEEALFFDKININANIIGQDCIFENSGFLFNGSYINFAGKIENYFSPQLDLELKSDYFDWGKKVKYISTRSKIKLSGISKLSLYISNTFDNPIVNGQVMSHNLTINGKTFEQLRAIVSYQDSIFKINEFSTRLDSLDLIGRAESNFSKSTDSLFFSITGTGKFFPTLVPLNIASLKNNNGKLEIFGKGKFSSISGSFDLDLTTATSSENSYQFDGDFKFQDEKIAFNFSSFFHESNGEGSINLADSRPLYQFTLKNIHNIIYSLPEFVTFKKIFSYKESNIQIRNEGKEWIINGDYIWNGEINRTAEMECKIKSQSDRKRVDTRFEIFNGGQKFVSQLNFIKTSDYWDIINFNIENIFESKGLIYVSDDKRIEASIVFPNASLPDLGNLIINDTTTINYGKLSGSASIGGSLKNPQVFGSLEFSELVMNHIGLYEGGVAFQLINKKLALTDFNINRNQQSLFKCNGKYALNTDELNFELSGRSIDMNSMVTTILNKPGLLEGTGSSNIQLKGHLNRPKIYGKINIENGKLGPFPFNYFQVDFGEQPGFASSIDSIDSDSSINEGVMISDIRVKRVGQFEMSGKGLIPYSNEKSMSIELNGKGNVLSLLPDLTHFFKETSSNGEWEINLGGRPNNIELAGGTLELSGGYLRLGDVAPEINNIAASMELEQDGFLNVKFISGKIKGKPFTFRNLRSEPYAMLETFSLPEYDLDLGIFTLETTSKGVPLHIPGLMKKRENVHLIVNGKNDREIIYFAGPLENPVVKGKVKLQNGNITFPFIKRNSTDSTRKDRVVEVLKQIEWDVTAEAGKDLHYQKEFPSGVDNAYLDLIANAGVGGLNFKGVINDSSFGVTGSLETYHGNVEYLDLNFEIIKAGVEFDAEISPESEVVFNKNSLLPIVYGEARTTVTDSTGYPYYVYLTLLTIDNLTGHALKRGRLGEVQFQLSADNPNLGLGYTEGELLASLGYSSSNIPKLAKDLIGISTDNLVFRPIFRPVERQLERTFNLDMVRFSSRFTRNLIEMNLNDERTFQLDSKLFLLRNTKLMVGKFLFQKLFLLYTGQLEAGMDYRYQQEGIGLRHTLGLEYRINPSLMLQMQYDYDSLLLWQKEDKRVMLRHSFPF